MRTLLERKKVWTEAEEEALRTILQTTTEPSVKTLRRAAKILGRSFDSIRARAAKLGLS